MYPFITLPVNYTFIPINRQDLPVNISTALNVHRCTCSVYLFLFGITSTVTFQLIYWGTYTQIYPKIKLPVYLHASLLSNYKDLPVTTTTCVHAHRSTRLLPCLFIWIISFRQTICTYLSCSQIYLFINQPFNLCVFFTWLYMHTYLSTHLLVCVPTDPPENECTC